MIYLILSKTEKTALNRHIVCCCEYIQMRKLKMLYSITDMDPDMGTDPDMGMDHDLGTLAIACNDVLRTLEKIKVHT